MAFRPFCTCQLGVAFDSVQSVSCATSVSESLWTRSREPRVLQIQTLVQDRGRITPKQEVERATRAISSFSRGRASARLAYCVRCARDVIIKTPSCVARLLATARRRYRTSGSERDWPTSKRSWTAAKTLLRFWPPGPEARTKVIVRSESGMNMGKSYFQNSGVACEMLEARHHRRRPNHVL
jgi:hypothetical protein